MMYASRLRCYFDANICDIIFDCLGIYPELEKIVNRHLSRIALFADMKIQKMPIIDQQHIAKIWPLFIFQEDKITTGGGHSVLSKKELDGFLTSMYLEIRSAASTNRKLRRELLA